MAQILNLVAEVVSSRAGSSEMRINGAELLMRWAGKETAFLWNAISQEEGQETGAVPILYLSDYRQGQNTNNGELSATHLKLGGTSLMPGFYLSTTGGEPTLWLMGESKGKKLSWKKNSDGTFTLIGKE